MGRGLFIFKGGGGEGYNRIIKVFQNMLHSSADQNTLLFEFDHFFRLQDFVKS